MNQNGITAGVTLQHSLLAVEGEHEVYGMLEISVPMPESVGERRPLAVAIVVDRSGSMGGPKLETTKACVDFLVRRLAATDQVALVDFDDEVRLLASLAPTAPDELAAIVAGIHFAGPDGLSMPVVELKPPMTPFGHSPYGASLPTFQ